jgi:hypothetical protein
MLSWWRCGCAAARAVATGECGRRRAEDAGDGDRRIREVVASAPEAVGKLLGCCRGIAPRPGTRRVGVEGTEGRGCCRGGAVAVLLRGQRRPEDAGGRGFRGRGGGEAASGDAGGLLLDHLADGRRDAASGADGA